MGGGWGWVGSDLVVVQELLVYQHLHCSQYVVVQYWLCNFDRNFITVTGAMFPHQI